MRLESAMEAKALLYTSRKSSFLGVPEPAAWAVHTTSLLFWVLRDKETACPRTVRPRVAVEGSFSVALHPYTAHRHTRPAAIPPL